MKAVFLSLALLAAGLFVMDNAFAAAEPAAVGTISGTVARDGKPVSNVKISLRLDNKANKGSQAPDAASPSTQPAEGSQQKHSAVSSTVSDADGKFTLSDVAPGNYVVVASDKHLGKGRSHITVSAGDQANIAIDLQPPKPKDKTKKNNKLGL
jgi:hypothetical protein